MAVDLPSGVDTDTGALLGEPMTANATIALGALKPAHLTGPSADIVGELYFDGLGIVQSFEDGLIRDSDLFSFVRLSPQDHKWKHAVQTLVGSTLMPGAAELVLRGALAGGASMIRLASRGDVATQVQLPPEVVHATDPTVDTRCKAVIAGPGLGVGAPEWLRGRLKDVACPVVLDADGLDRQLIDDLAPRDGTWVLTPHAGEFAASLVGEVGPDRLSDVRRASSSDGLCRAVEGPDHGGASPKGHVRVVTSGTEPSRRPARAMSSPASSEPRSRAGTNRSRPPRSGTPPWSRGRATRTIRTCVRGGNVPRPPRGQSRATLARLRQSDDR